MAFYVYPTDTRLVAEQSISKGEKNKVRIRNLNKNGKR